MPNTIDLSPIDFTTTRKRLFTEDGIKTERSAICRVDTGDILGYVSDAYNIIEHKPAFLAAQEALSKIGNFHVRKLQVNSNGARMFAHFELQTGFDIGHQDYVHPTLILTNSLDGWSKFGFVIGAFRLVCSNGLMAGINLLNINIKHTAEIDINEMGKRGQACIEVFENKVLPNWRRMNSVTLDMPKALDVLMGKKAIPQKITERVKNIASSTQKPQNTVWELFNHYTYHLTHEYQGSVARRMNLSVAVSRTIHNTFVA